MNILSARVDWNEEFDNPANLVVRVDELPIKELRYERKGRYLFAESQGYVSFFYDDPNDHAGYGGQTFKLTMKDGSETELIGPWSGNPDGAAAAGFPRSYDCTFEAPSQWGYGYTLYGGHLIESVWLDILRKFCPEADVAVSPVFGTDAAMSSEQNLVIGCLGVKPTSYSYQIVRKGMTPDQTLAFKRANRYTRYIGEVREDSYMYASPKKNQIRMAEHVNELIVQYDLAKFGLQPIDLNNLPPLLPEKKSDWVAIDPEMAEESY